MQQRPKTSPEMSLSIPCSCHFLPRDLGAVFPLCFWIGDGSLNSEGRKVGGTRGRLHRKLIWRGGGGNPATGLFFSQWLLCMVKELCGKRRSGRGVGDCDLLPWAQPILEHACGLLRPSTPSVFLEMEIKKGENCRGRGRPLWTCSRKLLQTEV